jgi:hypothetical protein
LEEAKKNLVRVVKYAHDDLEDEDPTTTGYTAKKLVDFIEQDRDKRTFPATVIDLPLKSDLILTALKLDEINRQLASVPSFAAYSEAHELSIEEIRELINRIMRITSEKKRADD